MSVKGRPFKNRKEYWLKRGYSLEESEKLSKNYEGYNNRGHYNFYLIKKITNSKEEAINLATQWGKTKCSLSKNYLMEKKFDSEEKYKEYTKKLSIGLNGHRWFDTLNKEDRTIEAKSRSCRCMEYWLKKGYDTESARKEISKHQDFSSLSFFIKKFGDKEGKRKYEILKEIRKEKSPRNLSDFQSNISRKSKGNKYYWMDKGYDEGESKKLVLEFIKVYNHFFKEYWMSKGYSEEESIKLAKKTHESVSKKGYEANRFISKLEIKVGEYLSDYFNLEVNHTIYDPQNNKYYFPDYYVVDLGCYLEIFGDYWHRNPFVYGIIDEGKRNDDKNRLSRIKDITNKKIIVVWESEIKDRGFKSLEKIVKEKYKKLNEDDDNTELIQTSACSGGRCELI